MEMILSFLWFAAGAVSALVVKSTLHFNEQRNTIVRLVATFTYLITQLKKEIRKGYQLKHTALNSSELDKKELDKIKELDNNVIENWELVSFAIMMECLPEKYRVFFEDSPLVKKKGRKK